MSLKATFYPDVPFETLYIPNIYREIYFDKIYEDVFRDKQDMVIIDVGANIGIVTRFMRKYARKIYAVEPSPENFEALKMNVMFNRWDNVIPFEFAISDKDGEADFNIWYQNHTGNSLVFDFKHKNIKTVRVITKRFDTFFKENKIGRVDFLKLDVEGAEDMILYSEGFKNIADKIQSMLVEFHYGRSDKERANKLIQHIVSFGFKKKKMSDIIYLFTR